MKKFLTIGEHVENYFLTRGNFLRALTAQQLEAQEELRAAVRFEEPLGDIIVPYDTRERRDMTATGTTSATLDQGGQTIPDDRPELAISLQRAGKIARLGGRSFFGLRGNIDLPYGKATVSAEWLAENIAASDASELFGSLSMRPHRVVTSRPVSQQLLIQGGPLFRRWIEDELLNSLAVEVDRVAIAGKGASSEPCGILNAISGTGSVVGGANGAAPTATHLADLELSVTGTNDAGNGSCGWLVAPEIRRRLRLTPYWSGSSDCLPIWSQNESDRLLGYPAGVTTAMPTDLIKGESTTCSPIIFGNFSAHITAWWGAGIGISIVSDRTMALAGNCLVLAAAYVDVGVRDPRAFDAMKDALAA